MKAARTRARNAKHAGSGKHGGTSKHAPTAHKRAAKAHAQTATRTAASTKAAKARALSLAEVACCAAEALAASLRLTGRSVSPADVLALHNHATPFPGAGASLSAALEAAYRHGLAGVRPLSFGPVESGWDLAERRGRGSPDHGVIDQGGSLAPHPVNDGLEFFLGLEPHEGSVILGLDLPEGPHAVAVDGDCWLSWGACYDPWPDALVDEAWVVTWP